MYVLSKALTVLSGLVEGHSIRALERMTGVNQNTIMSYVERNNLTMRMSVRRLARKTSAFSKKSENHLAALRLCFGYYNFVRWHRTLKQTPAMAAGITNHAWTLEELVQEALKKWGSNQGSTKSSSQQVIILCAGNPAIPLLVDTLQAYFCLQLLSFLLTVVEDTRYILGAVVGESGRK